MRTKGWKRAEEEEISLLFINHEIGKQPVLTVKTASAPDGPEEPIRPHPSPARLQIQQSRYQRQGSM